MVRDWVISLRIQEAAGRRRQFSTYYYKAITSLLEKASTFVRVLYSQ
jgi:hypothetical protein